MTAVSLLFIVAAPLLLCAQTRTPQTAKDGQDLIQGRQLGAQGKWKEAEVKLREYRQQNPDSTEAVALHAESLIKINQPFDAALELQAFLKQHPDALRAHELYAVLAAGPLRDVNLAIHELEICVKLAPKDFQAWESLGDAYLDQVKTDQAVRAYEAAARLRPDNATTIASLAHAYAENGDMAKALEKFKHAEELAAKPGQPEKAVATVAYLRGQFLAEHGSGDEAVTALTKALGFNPQSTDAYYWRARAYERMNDREHAIADAQKALALSPANKEAALFLITQYRKAGDMESAQKYAALAQKITDAEQAQQTFGRSLRDTLDKAEPLLREGQFAEVIPLYESIVKQLPTFYEAYFDLGTCYAQTGRTSDAEAALKKYLSFQPVSGDGHAVLGVVLAEEGKGTEAVAELTHALQIDPTLIEARKALANEYMQEKNYPAAVNVLRAAKNLQDVEAEMMLATALEKSGNHSSAMVAVNRALTIDPANAEALQLKQDLLNGGAIQH